LHHVLSLHSCAPSPLSLCENLTKSTVTVLTLCATVVPPPHLTRLFQQRVPRPHRDRLRTMIASTPWPHRPCLHHSAPLHSQPRHASVASNNDTLASPPPPALCLCSFSAPPREPPYLSHWRLEFYLLFNFIINVCVLNMLILSLGCPTFNNFDLVFNELDNLCIV